MFEGPSINSMGVKLCGEISNNALQKETLILKAIKVR